MVESERERGTGIEEREKKMIKRETGAVKREREREPQRVNHR